MPFLRFVSVSSEIEKKKKNPNLVRMNNALEEGLK